MYSEEAIEENKIINAIETGFRFFTVIIDTKRIAAISFYILLIYKISVLILTFEELWSCIFCFFYGYL